MMDSDLNMLSQGAPPLDVTQLFNDAAEVMQDDELIMVEGYTLAEAMSAIEIGDPRMDSGVVLPETMNRQPFEPLKPLLPEEVCWILDRSFACEVHWHGGNTLMQTVHTCLYMHHLTAIDPQYMARSSIFPTPDPQRPLELITIVIRSGILAMLKCCDMAYRELIKGNVHDTEDWQGEKAEITLYEGTPIPKSIYCLEEAEHWLERTQGLTRAQKDMLLSRIRLRKSLLSIYAVDITQDSVAIRERLQEARQHLEAVQNTAPPEVAENSPCHAAYDPYITRQLHSVMPLKALSLPSQQETWASVKGLLDGWEEITRLSTCETLLAWTAFSSLHASVRVWSQSRTPYLRSLAQTVFSNGSTILSRYPYLWLIDHFFLEIEHVTLSSLNQLLNTRWKYTVPHPFDDLQRELSKLLVQHVWATYHNRSRQRRHIMNTLVDWHAIYHNSLSLIAKFRPKDEHELRLLQCIPLSILHWRAKCMCDVILSGFELDLYSDDERPFAYWFLSETCNFHQKVLQQQLSSVAQGSPAHNYLKAQAEHTAALDSLALALFLTLCKPPKFGSERRYTNFIVRYKWAFAAQYKTIETPDSMSPDFKEYLRQEAIILRLDSAEVRLRKSAALERAMLHLVALERLSEWDPSLDLCRDDHKNHYLTGLRAACTALRDQDSGSDKRTLQWDPDVCPWFPTTSST